MESYRAKRQGHPNQLMPPQLMGFDYLCFMLSQPYGNGRNFLLDTIPYMARRGHRQEILQYLEAGLAQSELLGDQRAEAAFHLWSGIIYQWLGEYDTAETNVRASYQLYASLLDVDQQVHALNWCGYIRFRQTEYQAAHAYLAQARRLNVNRTNALQGAFSDFVAGLITWRQGRSEASLTHLQDSFEVW